MEAAPALTPAESRSPFGAKAAFNSAHSWLNKALSLGLEPERDPGNCQLKKQITDWFFNTAKLQVYLHQIKAIEIVQCQVVHRGVDKLLTECLIGDHVAEWSRFEF